MRVAGRVVARILQRIREKAVEGITTVELARISDAMIDEARGTALFKGVKNPQARFDFPASICASVNEEVVHGIPSERKLRNGDVISVDCGVKLNGYCGDSATTIMIGDVNADTQQLLRATEEMLNIAIAHAHAGQKWSVVARLMQEHAEQYGFGVVRDYVGHGIGRRMHEDPKVPNYVSDDLLRHDIVLRKGMVLAVEPMLNMGTYKTKVLSDGWTVVTADNKPAAHFEHTIAITENGADVLTLPRE